MKWYFYIDFGPGYLLVNALDLSELSIKWVRGELNEFIQRKKLEGSFTLHGTDFIRADTWFVANGNYEAALQIYENGEAGVGVLKFQGWITKSGLFNYREQKVTFSNFRTDDQYELLLSKYKNKYVGETLGAYGNIVGSFASQGQNANANKIHRYRIGTGGFIYDGALSIPNLGRCSVSYGGTTLHVIDNANGTLKAYNASGTSWVEIASITSFLYAREAVLHSGDGSGVTVCFPELGLEQFWGISGTTYTLGTQRDLPQMKFASATSNEYVDEETKTMFRIFGGNSIALGEISKPAICEFPSTFTGGQVIAFVDATQKVLKAYTFTAGNYVEGGSIQLTGQLYNPKITQYGFDKIVLHDAITGRLENWSYDGTTLVWTLLFSTTLQGGYASAIGAATSGVLYLAVAVSDTFIFRGSLAHSYYGLVNSLLFKDGIDLPTYELPATGSGSTIDVDKLIFQDMRDVSDNGLDDGGFNNYNYSLADVLGYLELFQNYWYIDSSNKIKFTQPALFSSFGISFDISATDYPDELNIREYTEFFDIQSEEIIFKNAFYSDFTGNKIVYARNSPNVIENNYNFTTDLERLVQIFTGQTNSDIEQTGLLLHIRDTSLSSFNTCASGVGIISGGDTRNYELSQSQIMNDYLKDYRLQETGFITINGTSTAVQNTCREIILFPEIEVDQEILGITEFPDGVGNLIWDTGVKSFVTEFAQNMQTGVIVIRSRLLDL